MPKQHSKNSFIEKANKRHKNKYNYSNIIYKNNKTKINIHCIKHGIFKQRPDDHLRGIGCRDCYFDKRRKTNKIFIIEANKVHNNRYNYSKFKYGKNRNIKGTIICDKHGEFKQEPNAHLKGSGCPTCCESTGEKIITNFLNNHNIIFEKEMMFDECKNKKHLFFDYYLPTKNLLIEYDGKQHFKEIDFFGGKATLKQIQKNDKIKNNFAKTKKINLHRISYLDFDNIENILKNIIK